MSDEEAKLQTLAKFDPSLGKAAVQNLHEAMLDRCEFPVVFGPIVETAFEMGAGDLILRCLVQQPEQRITAQEATQHAFFMGYPGM